MSGREERVKPGGTAGSNAPVPAKEGWGRSFLYLQEEEMMFLMVKRWRFQFFVKILKK